MSAYVYMSTRSVGLVGLIHRGSMCGQCKGDEGHQLFQEPPNRLCGMELVRVNPIWATMSIEDSRATFRTDKGFHVGDR